MKKIIKIPRINYSTPEYNLKWYTQENPRFLKSYRLNKKV